MNNEEETRWEVRPGGMLVQRRDGEDHHRHQFGPTQTIWINLSHGPNQHQLCVYPQSTFGDVKKVIERKTGLAPDQQKILFRGQEKEDVEYLHEAGVRDKSKVLLLEDPFSRANKAEQVLENEGNSNVEVKDTEKMGNVETRLGEEMSKALLAVAQVRAEVDKLGERVNVLEVVVNDGTKVSDEEFVLSSELLMRQLLKLDTIEAEGEARLQRKAEVFRIQKFHETLDNLKARNSKPFSNSNNVVSVTTEWETFESGLGSLTPPPMSSTTRITKNWERFD